MKLLKVGLFLIITLTFLFTRFSYLNSGIHISEPDEWYWHNSSQSLSENIYIPKVAGKPMVIHPPLFEYLGYWSSFIIPETKVPLSFGSTRFVSILASFGLTIGIYLYLRKKVNQTVAIYSLILMTITPIILFYSKLGLHDMLLTACTFLFYLTFEKSLGQSKSKKSALIAGLALALAIASKNSALILFGVPIIYLVLQHLQNYKTLLNLKPTWVFIQDHFKSTAVSLITGGLIIFLAYLPHLIIYPRYLKDAFLVSILGHGSFNVITIFNHFLYYLNHLDLWLSIPFTLLAVIGLLYVISKKQQWLLLLAFIITIGGTLLVTDVSGRYFLMITPYLVILAAIGLDTLNRYLRIKFKISLISYVIALAFFLLILPQTKIAFESTNHSVIEQVVRLIRSEYENKSDPLVFSTFWPNIIQETIGYKTVKLTASLSDSNADYYEYPSYMTKLEENPVAVLFKESGVVLIHEPQLGSVPPERELAIITIQNSFPLDYVITDNLPSFPEKLAPYKIYVYDINLEETKAAAEQTNQSNK